MLGAQNINLTPEQAQTLRHHGENFKVWVDTDKGKQDIQEHNKHEYFFKEKLSHQNLNNMTEDDFTQIWKKSWASKVWGNKDWYIKNRLVGPNGIEKIRDGLDSLLYGSDDFVTRYDKFREDVVGFGVATISEFLNMIFPDKYCLWNEKPKSVLQFLGLEALPRKLYDYNTATGLEYLQCINYLSLIKNELQSFGIRNFIDLDVFFWHIFEDVMSDHDRKIVEPKGKQKEPRSTEEESVWLVRAGTKGQGEKVALEKNFIGIGYGGFETSYSINDINAFRQHFTSLHPNKKTGTVNREVSQIWNFLHKMKKGDFVVLPLLAEKSQRIAIGMVEGSYQDSELEEGLTVLRPIKWLNKDVPKAAFDGEIAESLGYRGTVHRIGGSDISNKLKVTLRNLGVPETMITDEELVNSHQKYTIRPLTIDDLMKTTYLTMELLREIEALLMEKRQIIFYGPPGTSKTYVAKKFSEYFTQNSENVEIIQFHQSYSYEDFVEGIKPILSKTSNIEFSRQPGIFKNIVKKCFENPEKRFVLIIDEINRGNISKIFGELIYLLEYRDEKISLTYSPDEKFYIPNNLHIIGTMNSADRSIAFVDYALRRRFYFIDFYPSSSNGILYSWFKGNATKDLNVNMLLDMLVQINRKISKELGKEYQIGHSYFMVKDLDLNRLKMIIKYAIVPLIEQYYFGKQKAVEDIIEICNTVINPLPSEPDKFPIS